MQFETQAGKAVPKVLTRNPLALKFQTVDSSNRLPEIKSSRAIMSKDNSKALVNHRDLKTNDEFEMIKNRYVGQNSWLAEEQ